MALFGPQMDPIRVNWTLVFRAFVSAQGRRTSSNNPHVFSVVTEKQGLSKGISMWPAVPACAHLSEWWAQKLAQVN